MATIRPFRGVRYNTERIPDLSVVVSQPHDRVRHGLQDRYYELSPYNVVRLIKGKEQPGDGESNNVFTRARDTYRTWLREGILVREQVPAIYVIQQTFALSDGSTRTRTGLIAALELAGLDEGIVLPHERTLAKSMSGRLSLLQTTAVNLGCVLTLYPGAGVNELLEPAIERAPPFELRELFEHEVLQRFWVVTDPHVIAAVAEEMAPKRNLIIADGHHRYETALRYRDETRARHPDAPPHAAFNHRLVALVSMDDPGLVILPTHRLIYAHNGMSGTEALQRAREYFDIRPVADRQALEMALNEARTSSRPYFGFHDGTSAVLTLRDPDVMRQLLPHRSANWRMLDAAVVHELFVERVLGIDKRTVAENGAIEFLRDPQMGYDAVARGQADFLLVMNPTRVEQVQVCSAAGERMPQKSTDFYPKMISGLVTLPVGAEERL